MKVKYGKGGSSNEMYAEAGALITGLAKNKELRDAMKAEIAKYEDGGSVTGGDKGKKKPGGGSTDMDKDAMDPEVVGQQVNLSRPNQAEYKAASVRREDLTDEQWDYAQTTLGDRISRRLLDNWALSSNEKDKITQAWIAGSSEGLSSSQTKVYNKYKNSFRSELHSDMIDQGLYETRYIDKKTRQLVSPELIKSMQERGLDFVTDQPGLNATYTIGKKR